VISPREILLDPVDCVSSPPMQHRTHHAVVSSIACTLASAAMAGGGTAGDECFTSLPAVVGLNGPVSLSSMLPSGGTPTNGPCTFLNWTSTTRDAWWNFNAPIDGGLLSLDFCPSNFDTSVVIYQGECSALGRVACDDDSCQPLGPTYQSRINDLPVAGGDVYIRVGGYGGAVGNAQFALSFTPQGRVRAWGPVPAAVPAPADLLSQVVAVAAGTSHGLAVKLDGSVRAWGLNSYGQVGVPAGLGPVRAVAAGNSHSVALLRNGQVRAWGSDSYGEIAVPADLGPCTSIAAGRFFSAALTQTGTVRTWGGGPANVTAVPSGMGLVRAISAGSFHMLAIRGDGTVSAWGDNSLGQTSVPSDLGIVSAVAGGWEHSVALRPDGSLRSWGANTQGQQTPPADLGPVTKLVASGFMTATVNAQGRVRAWGQLVALGMASPVNVPADLGPAVALASSGSFAIAVTQTNPCSGDIDLTGAVDGADLGALLSSWGPAPFGASTDTNGDGVVDGADLGALLANWGTCG
jgi:alpha-tubulin suppressor-like RCC1 family protein